MSPPPALSFNEKLGLLPIMFATVSAALSALLFGFFRGEDAPPTYYAHVVFSAMRAALSRISIPQAHFVNPPTDVAYEAFMKSIGAAPESFDLAGGACGHWIGSSKAEYIVVYFHGGGYVFPANSQQFFFMNIVVKTLKEKLGKDVGAVFLQYDLAPMHQYPHQLQQGVSLVNYVINELGYKPSKVILAGDSAGGNMCLGLCSHISHPHPSLAPLKPSEPFFGAALISPWVTFSESSSSFTSNRYKDMLSPEALGPWSKAYQGLAPTDPFNQPLTAPANWWKDLQMSEMLLMGGADELFIDDIKAFGEVLGREWQGKTTTVFSPGTAHDQPLVDGILGAKEPGDQTKAFISWIGART